MAFLFRLEPLSENDRYFTPTTYSFHYHMVSITVIEAVSNSRQCPHLGRHYGIKNKAAIALQCESDVKLIAALLFIPYSSPIWGDSQFIIIYLLDIEIIRFTFLNNILRSSHPFIILKLVIYIPKVQVAFEGRCIIKLLKCDATHVNQTKHYKWCCYVRRWTQSRLSVMTHGSQGKIHNILLMRGAEIFSSRNV